MAGGWGEGGWLAGISVQGSNNWGMCSLISFNRSICTIKYRKKKKSELIVVDREMTRLTTYFIMEACVLSS